MNFLAFHFSVFYGKTLSVSKIAWRPWRMNKWVWSFSGMMTGETEVIGEGIVPGSFGHQKYHTHWPGTASPISHCTPTTYQRVLRKRKFHYRVHKSPISGSYPEQTNPVHFLLSYFFRIHVTKFFRLHRSLPSGPFAPGFPTKTLHSFLGTRSVRSFNTWTNISKVQPTRCKVLSIYLFLQIGWDGTPWRSISSTIAAGSSIGLTIPDAVCTVLCSWWWAEEPPETYRAIYRNK